MMHLSQTNTKDFDELVFNDRNRAYGAYVLRKNYSSTMLKSLLIGVAFTASLLATPYLSNLFKKEKPKTAFVQKEIILADLKDDKVEDEPERQTRRDALPPSNTMIYTIPEITPEDLDDTLTTTIDLESANPGHTNSLGGEPGEWGIPGGCDDCDDLIDEDDTQDKVTFFTDPPKFPGGDDAMRDFLGNNLVYPEHARQIHLEGTVHVTFVVDPFGNIGKVTVPRVIGGGLDEEAMRVVSLMPRWEPGRQNGRPVKVAFRLPIIFKLN